jgi:hypothetical protein
MNIKIKTPKARVTWGFNPVSRVVPSKKRYTRKNVKNLLKKGSLLSCE